MEMREKQPEVRQDGREKTLEAVRAYFAADRYAADSGAVIEEFGEGYALCSLQVEARHRNAIGAVMGGVLFTLADFAFAVAANWKQPGTVSLHGDIAFLSGVRGERLLASEPPGSPRVYLCVECGLFLALFPVCFITGC